MIIVMLVVLAVTAFVGEPVWREAMAGRRERGIRSSRASDLRAERDAKLREIRDAELDWRTGKLTEADWQLLDASLRSEAAAILRRLDAAEQEELEAG